MTDRTILLVEDDEPTQRLLQALLLRSGFSTVSALNGDEAMARLREQRFAAVILDLMMKASDGWAVVDFLRQQESVPPVIVCTALGPNQIGELDGRVVRAIIRKPFDIEHLLTTLRGLTHTEEEPHPCVLIVDDDLRSRYVMRAFIESADAFEAETGEDALVAMRDRRPDVVLLDLGLPGISGEEVLRRIAEDPLTRDTPVVIVTSRPLEEEERRALLGRAAGIIDKRDLSRATLNGMITAVITSARNGSN